MLALVAARQLGLREQREQLRAHIDQWQPERDSLRSFIPAVYKTDTGEPAYLPEHLLRIIEVLEDDGLGDTLIIAPPGAIKTNTLIAAAAWWLGRDPMQHIAFFSNTDRQAYKRSVAIRDTISRNGAYHAIFPDAHADYRKGWAEFEWFLDRPDVGDKDASLMAAGVGSAIQGSRLNRGLIDDIADKKNMATALQRAKVIEWLKDQVMTRFGPGSRKVALATRWHAEDPAAWMIKQGWRVIHLKAIEDGRSYWPERWPVNKLACPDDAHGQGDPGWEPSDEQPQAPCWIERNEAGRITAQGNCQKYILGSRGFNLTYQGETTDDASSIFKRSWWQFYDSLDGVSKAQPGIFVDLAHEEKTEADYTAMGLCYFAPPRFYVADAWKRRLEFPEVLALLRGLVKAAIREDEWATHPDVLAILSRLGRHTRQDAPPFPHYPVIIEDTPGSKPLIQTLKREIPGVIAWAIEGRNLMARSNAVAPYVEARNVYLPRNAPWVGDFIEEHAVFPGGEHDDQLSWFTMMMLRYTRGGSLQSA